MPEMIDIVDDDDKVLYVTEKEDMLDKRLLHRGVGIFVFNSKGEVFIHRRPATKRLYPGEWAAFFGGSAIAGETYLQAARRELEEETGIKDIELKFMFKQRFEGKHDRVFGAIFACVYDDSLNLQKEEISEGMFVTLDSLKQMMKKEKFTEDSLFYMNMARNLSNLFSSFVNAKGFK